ncbi:MAG: HD domain-containing protein [Anaerolineaceae bacterium]|nr:HD domain-containing protein [Anaerolineaceae bacterium]
MDDAYDPLPDKRGLYDYVLWLNASDALAPAEMPEHDLDFSGFEQLTNLASTAPRPSVDQCLDWWEKWRMPENIHRHVSKVAEAAYKLAIWMRHAGMAIDPILTHRAALVHDLDKIQTLHQPSQHGHISAEYLADQGYPEVADIVRNHLLGIFLTKDMSTFSWETKLVNFCDKLVEEDRIVTLPVRFFALKQRYPHSQVLLDSTEPYLWQLNDEICSILSLESHEALVSELNA